MQISFIVLLFFILSLILMHITGSLYLNDSRPLLQQLVSFERVQKLNHITYTPLLILKQAVLYVRRQDSQLEQSIENRIIKIRFAVSELFS